MLAELHARWEREDEMARKMKVCTITTSNDVVPDASNPLTLIGVEKTPTPCNIPSFSNSNSACIHTHLCIFEINLKQNFKNRRLTFSKISFKAYVSQIEFSNKNKNKFKCFYTQNITVLFIPSFSINF
jgi:hypothetical protein